MRPASAKGVEARLAAFKDLAKARQVLPGTVVRQSGKFGAFVEVSHPDGSNVVGLVPSQEKAAAAPRSLEHLHIGQELTGVVIRVQPVVLIDVGLKIRGVLPAGKISSQNDADEDRVNLGDRVQVWVSEIRNKSSNRDRPTLILAMEKNKIYSLWNSGPVANLEDFQGLDDQEWYTGTLTHKMQAGWFVSVPSPVANGEPLSRHGLVYLPECKGDAEIGSSVKVRVLGADLEKGHLYLSMRTSPPLRGTEAKLALYRDLTDHWLEGRVKSFGTGGAYGASVEVRHPAAGTMVGILPKAQMDPEKQLVVDGKIQVRVWDVTDDRLFLSMQEKVKEMPKEFLALVEDELGSASAVELLEEGQKVDVRVTDAGKEGLKLALCT
ncbi:rpsA [Symbiodinium necroappetens]|uniref:RpsA protein n=1 Tax=Symbiodinium necroappetens TaxID=1628268 RepID=A0A812JRC9_9DINO|nr:rpsA [Symbiodinium necroappetens]